MVPEAESVFYLTARRRHDAQAGGQGCVAKASRLRVPAASRRRIGDNEIILEHVLRNHNQT